jgi:hypothetical protein
MILLIVGLSLLLILPDSVLMLSTALQAYMLIIVLINARLIALMTHMAILPQNTAKLNAAIHTSVTQV